MVEVNDIHKSFGEAHVLKGVSASFQKGMTNLIIGQSGSGKTVFLKCLLGLFTPEEGTISYDGKIYAQLTDEQKRDLRQEMGMVFQGGALFDSMTVEDNIMFPLTMYTDQTLEEKKERVNFCLDWDEIPPLHGTPGY